MNHQDRVDVYKRYMATQGARMDAAAPPLWEAMWARGIEVPPPPFLGPAVLGLFGALSTATIPAILWLFSLARALAHPLSRHAVPGLWAAWMTAAAGLFGLVAVPVYYHRMASRHGLARWATFTGVRQRS